MIDYILTCQVKPRYSRNGYYFEINSVFGSINDQLILEYIGKYNNSRNIFILSNINPTVFRFRIVWHGFKDLFNTPDHHFSQGFLKESNKTTEKMPTIHLTYFNCFQDNPEDIAEKYLLTGSRRYQKIMDSSIWNYYVPIFNSLETTNYQSSFNVKLLHEVLLQIHNNYIRNLYDLSIAREYADLNARLLEQSYLAGSHKVVSPFLFHSETEMLKKIAGYENEKEHNASLSTIRKYRWRFLLLDDKSIEKMRDANGIDQNVEICKLQIIAHNLRLLGFEKDQIWFRVFDFKVVRDKSKKERRKGRILNDHGDDQRIIDYYDADGNKIEPFILTDRVKDGVFKTSGQNKSRFEPDKENVPDNPNNIQIVIDCVKHVDAAQYCLQKYKYEIVLLDYLLHKDKFEGSGLQEYGYHLLEQLNIWHQGKKRRAKAKQQDEVLDNIYQPGPNGRFFFMFISAFTTAVHERMLEKGYGKTEPDLWFIGDGACPTNTPCLFAYQLLLLMRYRIKDLSLDNEGGFLTLIDLLKEIFVNADPRDKLTDVRERAHNHFNHVLFMRDKYKKLENDLLEEDEKKTMTGKEIMNMPSSFLIQSAFQYVHHFSGAFFEHLQHLIYLTAFGTIRQWTELWEEYVFIHKTLLRYDDLTGGADGLTINQAIRDYIIQLKENSN